MYNFEKQSLKKTDEDTSESHHYTWRTRSWVHPLRYVGGKWERGSTVASRPRSSIPSEPETSGSEHVTAQCPLCAIRGITLSQWEQWADLMGHWMGVAPVEQGVMQNPVEARPTEHVYGKLTKLKWPRQWGHTVPY